ncbi:Do family serine endopeptidase [Porphyromonas canoris]|uniref:Deoxyribonuclease HsdR n=1 Tax=Porphyromonas canoris TaxID=36875 RepID=A0ABR4XL54_9PORP|nr:Do family serine endopeptidase [Porphyromonas canoris]KGN92550.1 deoxyribonuclease HsdR [Porphyromonas canoris]
MKTNTKFVLAIIGSSCLSAVLAVGLYAGYTGLRGTHVGDTHAIGNSGTPSAAFEGNMQQVALAPAGLPKDFVEAAERSVHGVVHIRAELSRNTSRSGRRAQEEFIDPFEFFFGPGQGSRRMQTQPSYSMGSGVIISSDGYIITNNHVVEGSNKLTITLNDNKEYNASIIGTDKATDLALLKIEAKDLPVIPFGDSEALKVGEWVLAVGNPFNLTSTVTAGIVSAKGRNGMPSGNLQQISSFIQTDAAVNSGNSGGALVNTRGELVGINTMIYSQNGQFAGYSFAIPVSIASKVVTDLKQYGAVQRAILGVVGSNIDSDSKEKFGLKVSEGAVVQEFADFSPAKAAGVQVGDVITEVNGAKIRSISELQEQISKYRPGDQVKLRIDRKGKSMELNVALKNSKGNTEVVRKASFDSLGAAFRALSAEKRKSLGIDFGVEVAGVDDGRLSKAGIRKGFIILSVNNVAVQTPEDMERIVNEVIASSSSDKVLFIKGLQPNGERKYFAIDLS